MGVGAQSHKCIHSVKSALVIHNHSPRECLQISRDSVTKECATYVQPFLGYTHHHRKSCCENAHFKDNADPKKVFHADKTILRYGKRLQKNSEKVLDLLFTDGEGPNGNLLE